MDIFGNGVKWMLEQFVNILESILNLFPDMPSQFAILPESIITYTYWVGNILDMTAFTFVIATIIMYEIFMVTVRFSLWIWRLLPFT